MARKMPKKAQLGFEGVDINFLGSKEEAAEQRTVESRKRLRKILDAQIQEFIAKGGEIQEVDTHITSDPPKKPQNFYGNRPI